LQVKNKDIYKLKIWKLIELYNDLTLVNNNKLFFEYFKKINWKKINNKELLLNMLLEKDKIIKQKLKTERFDKRMYYLKMFILNNIFLKISLNEIML